MYNPPSGALFGFSKFDTARAQTPPIQVVIGSSHNAAPRAILSIPLNVVDLNGDTRTIGGKLTFDHSVLRFLNAKLGPTATHFSTFGAYDNGQFITFGGAHNIIPITIDGTAVTFDFEVIGERGSHTDLILHDVEVGPDNSVETTNGAVNVKNVFTISGQVVSFTGQPDRETRFRYLYPAGDEIRSLSGNAEFIIDDAAPGDHQLYFLTWDPDKDRASVDITDVTWEFLCYLGSLDQDDCQMIAVDTNLDNELTMTDVLYVGSYVLGINEGERSKVGTHRYEPNPLKLMQLSTDWVNQKITSAVSGDPSGSRFNPYIFPASMPETSLEQNGAHATVTIKADRPFYGALVQLNGANILNSSSINRTALPNGEKVLVYGENASNEISVEIELDSNAPVSLGAVEINDPLPDIVDLTPDLHTKIFMPLIKSAQEQVKPNSVNWN